MSKNRSFNKRLDKSNPYASYLAAQKGYVPGRSAREDDSALQNYINDIIRNADNRNGMVLIEDDWDTQAPIHKARPESEGAWPQGIYTGDDVLRRDLVGNVQPLLDEWNKQRVGSSNKGDDFNYLMREVDKLIRADTERLSNMPLAEYKSKFPQMSTMTGKARGLREARKNREQTKGAAYSRKIKNLLNRAYAEPGFTNAQTKDMVDYLRGEGVRSTDNIAKRILEKEFQDNYKTRGNILNKLVGKTLDKDALKNEIDLQDLSKQFGVGQKRQDRELAGVFSNLGDAKSTRESALINTLDRFGNQQHIYDEIQDKGNKKVFDIESYLPYSKLNNLKTAVSNTKLEPGNPISEKQARDMVNKALLDYGIAGVGGNNNNFAAWDKNRVTDKPVLIDNLTEELPEKVLESQYTLQRLDPKFKSDLYNQKKNIQKELYGSKASLAQDLQDKTLANAAYNNTMKVAPQELALLDSALKKEMKQQMNRIANKYIRLGQYGSPQNIRESEKMANELAERFAGRRSAVFNKRLEQEGELERGRNIEQRALLDDITKQENKQFDNILERILETNNVGAQSWNNLQAAKNQKTNAYLNNLKFAESIPSLGGRLTEYINPAHEANFNARTQNYLNRKPLSELGSPENLSLNNINRVANFNESDKASDPYVNAKNNSLQNYFQYDPMVKEDALQAAGKYNSSKKSASNRKKQIEETADKARREALAKAAENARDFGKDDLNRLSGLVSIGDIERIADFIEEKTKHRFPLYPQYMNQRNIRYHPSARQSILNTANKYLQSSY